MINLWYENSYSPGVIRGPVKVIVNTIKSFEDYNIEFSLNFEKYKFNFFLTWNLNYYKIYSELKNKDKFLVGPQIWPFSPEFSLIDSTSKIIVPSQWVANLFHDKFNTSHEKMIVWPCPIYAPKISSEQSVDCLIYFKNRSQEDLFKVKKFLDEKNITYLQLTYGSYTQDDFKNVLSKVKFCVIIDSTESQGIAIQEMMALNKPLFVWDYSVWDHQGPDYAVLASSVPYWSNSCGKLFTDFSQINSSFEEFMDNFDNYFPSEFVLNELSPSKSISIILEHYLN